MTALHESLPPPGPSEAAAGGEDGRLGETREDEEVEAEEKRRAEGEHGDHHKLARSAARCETVLLCHENASLSRILQVIQSSPTPMISGFMVTTV